MLLVDVAAASRTVSGTTKRSEKSAAVAGCLQVASPVEVPIVVAYLSGELRQRRTGVGWASLRDLPEPAELDLPAGDAAREPLEGMLVSPVDRLTVSEVFRLTRFGELTLSQGGLLVNPTEVARPGPAADAFAAAAAIGVCSSSTATHHAAQSESERASSIRVYASASGCETAW